MKMINNTRFLLLFLVILLSGCDMLPVAAPTAPVEINAGFSQTWIEFPRNGQILKKETIQLVAYATATESIPSITLSMNGAPLPAGAVSSISSDGSKRIARLDQAWVPPGAGEYTLQAASGSDVSTITFCVKTCDPSNTPIATTEVLITEETPSAAQSTDTPQPPTATLTANPTLTPSITFTKAPTRTFEPTYTAPPPADTSGPVVNSVATIWEGCTLYGTANISDPSGVIWAEFWFNKNGEGWAWILMNQSGDQWISQVGVDTGGFSGTLEYKVRTEDAYNNESWSGVFTKPYEYCGE